MYDNIKTNIRSFISEEGSSVATTNQSPRFSVTCFSNEPITEDPANNQVQAAATEEVAGRAELEIVEEVQPANEEVASPLAAEVSSIGGVKEQVAVNSNKGNQE